MRQEEVEATLRRPSLEAEWRQLVATWPEVEACTMAGALGSVRQAREALVRQAAMVVADEERPVAVLAQYLSMRGLLEHKRQLMARLSHPTQACDAARLALELALESRLLAAVEELVSPTLSALSQGLSGVLNLATLDWQKLGLPAPKLKALASR